MAGKPKKIGRLPWPKTNVAQGVIAAVRNVMLGRQDDLDNRREAPRVRVRFPVICRIGEEDYLGETVDLSNCGMRVRIPVPMKVGEVLRLSSIADTGFVGRQRLRCKSLWVRALGAQGYEVGSYYDDTEENLSLSWVQSAIKRLNATDRANRKQRRIPANVYAELQDNEGEVMGRALCVNLSTGGCLISFERDLSRGDVVRLGLGPNDREPAVLMLARVVSKRRSSEPGYFLSGLRFLPSDKRQHQRLRSFLQTLLEDAEADGNLQEEHTVELDAIIPVESPEEAPPEDPPEPEASVETPVETLKLRIPRPERPQSLNFERKRDGKKVTDAEAPVPLGAPAEKGVFRGKEEAPEAIEAPPEPVVESPPGPALELVHLPMDELADDSSITSVTLPPLPKSVVPRSRLYTRRFGEMHHELPGPEMPASNHTPVAPPTKRLTAPPEDSSATPLDPPIFLPLTPQKAPQAAGPVPLGAPAELGVFRGTEVSREPQPTAPPAPVPLGAPVEHGVFKDLKPEKEDALESTPKAAPPQEPGPLTTRPPGGQLVARTPSLWAARTIALQPQRRQGPQPRGTGLFIEPVVEDPESDFRS